jgi:sigma-B regulation protein RsbU (phosphoserine phosphatase)
LLTERDRRIVKEPIPQNAMARELDERLVELQSLFEMSQVLNSSLQLRTTLNNLLLTPMGRMMIGRGVVLVTTDNGLFEISALKGLPRSLAGKKVHCSEEMSEPLRVAEIPAANEVMKSFFEELEIDLIIPIISVQRTVGIMGLGRKLGGVPFSPDEVEYLTSLSNIASSAIENALMYQKLERVNRQLDKKVQELRTLFEIGKELNATLEKERIVNLLIYAIMGELVVSRCYLYLQEGNTLFLFAARGLRVDDQSRQELSTPAFLSALAKIDQVVDIDKDELAAEFVPFKAQQLKLAIPMQIQEETRGLLVVGEKITPQAYQADEIEFLATLCNLAMISIENARLFEEALEKERIEEELNIARDIQQRLLPRDCPHTERIEVKGMNIPTRQVGGDYFDCIQIDRHHLAITIADVSGKGVPASLLMSSLHAGLHNLVAPNGDIAAMVGRLNNFIQANTGYDKFITFFYGEFDFDRASFSYVNAGHNLPYLFRKDGTVKRLDTGGLLLGMMPNMPYQSEVIPLQEGDVLFLFTDGVTEAKSAEDEDFEESRLEQVLRPALDLSMQELITRVVEAVRTHSAGMPQFDDLTMMAVRWLK